MFRISDHNESNRISNNDNYAKFLSKVVYFVDFKVILRLPTFWAEGALCL